MKQDQVIPGNRENLDKRRSYKIEVETLDFQNNQGAHCATSRLVLLFRSGIKDLSRSCVFEPRTQLAIYRQERGMASLCFEARDTLQFLDSFLVMFAFATHSDIRHNF